MKTQILKVYGMSCSHCENAVNDAVGNLEGVSFVKADAKNKTVTVTFDEEKATLKRIKEVINDEGYETE